MKHPSANFNRMVANAVLTVAVVGLLMPVATSAITQEILDADIGGTDVAGVDDPAMQTPEYKALKGESDKEGALNKTGAKDKSLEVGCDLTEITCGILKGINWVLDRIKTIPVELAESFLQRMIQLNLDEFNGGHILNTARVGWSMVLGIVNMFFVLWLLWIAIATIFDFQPFTARALLPKLIIAALLINFSFVIGSSFVRLTNGIGSVFAEQLRSRGGINSAIERMTNPDPIILTVTNSYFSGDPKEAQKKLQTTTKTVETAGLFGGTVNRTVSAQDCSFIARGIPVVTYYNAATPPADKRAIDAACKEILTDRTIIKATEVVSLADRKINMLAIGIVAKIVTVPISIFALFAAGIFLLIRLISLMLLLIFSPLAFLSLAIPGLGALGGPVSWSGWWNSLVKWSFYLPAFLFLFMISLLMLSGIAPESLKFSIQSGKELPDLAALFVSYAMGIALMIGSIMVANQMGIHSASTVTGWGKSMGKATGGWFKGTGKILAGGAAGAALGSGAGQWLASRRYLRHLGRPLEAITAAGLKVQGEREKAATKRRGLAAKVSPQYRWALMQGMSPSEQADFVRESKPHELRSMLNTMEPADRIALHTEMKRFDLDDKLVEATQDLTAAIEMETGTNRADAGFQEAFNNWIKSATVGDIQKRVSMEDIRNNAQLHAAIMSPGVLEMSDLKTMAHTGEKSNAMREYFIDVGGRAAFENATVAMKEGGEGLSRMEASERAINRAIDEIGRSNRGLAAELAANSGVRLNLALGRPIGRKAGPAVIVVPGPAPTI